MCHNEGGASQVYSQCISVAQTYISPMQGTMYSVLYLNNTIV